LKIARGSHAFLLESVENGETWSRYSILGADPAAVYFVRGGVTEIRRPGRKPVVQKGNADALVGLDQWLKKQRPLEIEGLPPFWGGAVGFLGYDAVRDLEHLPDDTENDLDIPEAVFMLCDTVVVFDNLSLTMKVISSRPAGRDPGKTYDECTAEIDAVIERLQGPLPETPPPPPRRAPRRFSSSFTKRAFEDAVGRAKEYIRSGDAVQVVLSQRFEKKLGCDPLDLYRALRVINPSSYMYYLKMGEHRVVGSSPEVLVRVTGDQVQVRPIAGTRPRGASRAEDAALAKELLADEKERAEHVMLVDLGRNDLGRVCDFHSVDLTEFMTVERYSHVMHLVSNVVGKRRKGVTSLDVLRAAFPAGTVSGAPKVRAMEIIEELEPYRRGTYAGAIGYLSFDGNLDTCIAIRTAYIEDDVLRIGAGAGIVADSDPKLEYRETMNKAKALFEAVEAAEKRRLAAGDGR
ncbi:anthranilate synthase component I, partial [bacterium]|nr:anthranilate synthase component I [bacterium]